MNPDDSGLPQDAWQVVCLCAQWCGACREWRVAFDQTASAFPRLRFTWVDIEDQADAVGDVDIETFPTLLIAQGMEPRFYGPVQPSQGQFARLLDSLLATPGVPVPAAADISLLLRRLILGISS